jgi:hypothetical protein
MLLVSFLHGDRLIRNDQILSYFQPEWKGVFKLCRDGQIRVFATYSLKYAFFVKTSNELYTVAPQK